MSDDLVEAGKAEVARIEATMLAAPAMIPALREDREAALEDLARAQEAERRAARREVALEVDEAIRAARRDPAASWHLRFRRHHSLAAKAAFVRRLGLKGYIRAFPW